MNQLTDYLVCKLNIEKSTTALLLEREYGLEWGFDQKTPLDGHFHLRACIQKPVTIEEKGIIPLPTGIYPHIQNPNFELEVNTLSSALYDQGLALAEGVTYFSHTFRNEIWLLIENKFKKPQVIQPTQNIALLSVKLRPRIVINYVNEIEKMEINIGSSKTYIQKIKKKLNPELYDNKKAKHGTLSADYTRENISLYTKGEMGHDELREKKQFRGAKGRHFPSTGDDKK
jgi:dUTPase